MKSRRSMTASIRSVVSACFALALVLPIWPRHSLAAPRVAVATNDFLNSIGVVTTFPDRGQPLARTIEMVRYCGFRWVRAGIEGLSDKGPTTIQTFLDLHRETGVRLSWGLVSGGTDVKKLVETGKVLAEAGALLAFEGNNEPNNWGVTYQGEKGGGREPSWMAVAKLQRDLYQAVKRDPVLAKYPVWSISEPGAQRDNVGLQFLTIPPGAQTLMPDGTKYADYANVHNYIYHPHSPYLADNKTWHAADPTAASKVDGLFGNFGVTWARTVSGLHPRAARYAAACHDRERCQYRRTGHGRDTRLEPDELLPRAVQAWLRLHIGLSVAGPYRRRWQPIIRFLPGRLFAP